MAGLMFRPEQETFSMSAARLLRFLIVCVYWNCVLNLLPEFSLSLSWPERPPFPHPGL